MYSILDTDSCFYIHCVSHQIWNMLSEINCPGSMKEEWSSMLQTIAEERVSKVGLKYVMLLVSMFVNSHCMSEQISDPR